MKALKILLNVVIVATLTFIIIGIPTLVYYSKNASYDAKASASMDLPDIPSGEFLVLINNELHKDTLDLWISVFTNDEENIQVIFEDISCYVSTNDTSAIELAKRYQIYLPENQMTIKYENAVLLASKVESGILDVMIFSKEFVDYLNLNVSASNVTQIIVKG